MASSGIPPVCYVVDHAIEKKWPPKVSAYSPSDPSQEASLAQDASVRLGLESQTKKDFWEIVRSKEQSEEESQ